jgi:CBS domain-containing protein
MDANNLLTPKTKVEYLYNDITVGEAIAKMKRRRYALIPVLERNSNRYLYSISSSDLLYKIMQIGDVKKAEALPLSEVEINRLVIPAPQVKDIESLGDLLSSQNFVPIVDEKGIFLGLVTRRSVFNYLLAEKAKGE